MINKRTGFDICIVIDLRGGNLTLEALDGTLATMVHFYGCEWPNHHYWVTREDIGRGLMFHHIQQQQIITNLEKKFVFERFHEPTVDLYLPDRTGMIARIINFKLPEEL